MSKLNVEFMSGQLNVLKVLNTCIRKKNFFLNEFKISHESQLAFFTLWVFKGPYQSILDFSSLAEIALMFIFVKI